jgi:mono/diheme cytochrome c family protein
MNLSAHAILLAIFALAGCGERAVLPANAAIAAADTQLKVGEARGALLYSTHCAACHTSKIHWREKRLVTDMESLKQQVRRWQASIDLGWTEDEIADVVRYLNAVYYNFQDAGNKGLLEGEKPLQALRKN